MEELEASSWDAIDIQAGKKEPDEDEASELRHRVDALEKQLAERDARVAEMQQRIDDSTQAPAGEDARVAEMQQRIDALTEQLAERDARIATLESSAAAPGSGGDDFTRIKGIGPKFDRALKAAGVSTYAQMAAWTDEDVATIAARIKTTVGRIRRDRWVERARELGGQDTSGDAS